MKKPLISHEIPKQLFSTHDFINDYPYVLAHLCIKNSIHYDKEYSDFYKEKLKIVPFSIYDNSLFELGDSIDYKVLYELGEEYKPSHIILPDCLNNAKTTKERAIKYIEEFGNKSTPKFIGVVHGNNYDEIRDLLYFFEKNPLVDIIAIPFDIMSNTVPVGANKKLWRVNVFRELIYPTLRGLSSEKKIHLLGCHTPLEFKEYTPNELKKIYSIDTSAPIVYGWSKVDFSNVTLDTNKPKDKLAENLNIELNQIQLDYIAKNVRFFRNLL